MRQYRRSQSVQESCKYDIFSSYVDLVSQYLDSPDRAKRSKSYKKSQLRKIMSVAQSSRIEERFNINKLKRRQFQEQKESRKKMGSGLELSKLKINTVDLMFENKNSENLMEK